MLVELSDILDASENEQLHQREFEAAAALLLHRQFIWADGFGQRKAYDLIVRFQDYFDALFDAIGFDMVRDYRYGYSGIVPRNGQPSMRKLDTLVLLLLARMHDDYSRRACTDRGCSQPCMAALLDLYVQLTGLEKPTRIEFISSLKKLAGHGVIYLGEIDEVTQLPKVTVTPALMHLVTSDFLSDLRGFCDDSSAVEANQTQAQSVV